MFESKGTNLKRAACALPAALLFVGACLWPNTALAFDPCGSVVPDAYGTQTLSLLDASSAGDTNLAGIEVKRLAGETRYDTMQAVSQAGFSKNDTVVIAYGENFPDALAASALAGCYDAPILLTGSGHLSSQAKAEVQRLGAKKALILGGSAVVSDGVLSDLASLGVAAERVAGAVRQDTANAVARRVGSLYAPDTAVIASGYSPWDAISVSPYAYGTRAPVFLTEAHGTLSVKTLDAIKAIGTIKRIIIVGGPNVVASSTERSLRGYSVERWYGADRYATSAEIAKRALNEGSSASCVAIASAESFPDALTGGALVGKRGGVVLLASQGGGGGFDTILKAHKDDVSSCYVLGGEAALSREVSNAAASALSYTEFAEGGTVLAFAPHQDDELLSMGAYLEKAVSAGQEVHAVLCTDGSASWVKGELKDGGSCAFHSGSHAYDLTTPEFVRARDDEHLESCEALGIKGANVHVPLDRAKDGCLTVEAARRVILEYLALYPGATVCVTNPYVGSEQHADHTTLGKAAVSLYKEGKIKELRLFVEPYLIDAFEKTNPGARLRRSSAESETEKSLLEEATDAYSLWDPARGRYAIGYHSVGNDFSIFLSNPPSSWWQDARDIAL